MGSVEIDGIGKSYGNLAVLHDISLAVEDGEFIVLVGPSGCGKSTLLRMIAGLEDTLEGEIRIGGRIVNEQSPKERNIAMVFQNYALYPHMTVAENMGFSLRLSRVDKDEINEKLGNAASILGLADLMGRYPRQLSGGQRQRVAMGRAIVRDPTAFLFDEPLSNLDAKLRVQMRAEIKALHQRISTTMIYVTHDQVEAMTMADRIVVMRDGRIEQIGAPLDVYDRPANMFVAGFIGSPSMNFLAGKLESQDNGTVFTLPGGTRIAINASNLPAGSDVVMGVRPEHFIIADKGAAAAVTVIEPMGSETQIHARMENQEVVILSHQRQKISPGETVHLDVDAGAVRFFDRRSRRCLPVL